MTTLVLDQTEPLEPDEVAEPDPIAAAPHLPATGLRAVDVSAWFGAHQVLERINLEMPARTVTALIGPSGCGKSTFLRILNRMHELVPSASLAGEVLLVGETEVDIYDADQRPTDTRRRVGMVFQKPNPFPAMSIADNVLSGLGLSGLPSGSKADRAALVEECLTRAGLWNEVKSRLGQPGGGLSGGQQQRLCIARSLAVRPEVLLMDEPCSALDPTSTRRIEETILDLAERRDRGDRDPQHAAGAAGLEPRGVLPRRRGRARPHRRGGQHRGDLRYAGRSSYGGLRRRPLRLSLRRRAGRPARPDSVPRPTAAASRPPTGPARRAGTGPAPTAGPPSLHTPQRPER